MCLLHSTTTVLNIQGWSPPQEDGLSPDFVLNNGDVLGLVGLSGSGKSYCCGQLVGLRGQASELVKVCDYPVCTPEARRLYGYVPSRQALYEELTCSEYLRLFAEVYKVDRHYAPYMIAEVLSLVRLDGHANTLISALEDDYVRKRLSLARALVHDPRLVVIDDCLGYMQPSQVKDYADILRDVRNLGKVLVLASSRLAGIESLCSHVGLLSDTHMLVLGKVSEIAAQLAAYHLYQIQFLSDESVYLATRVFAGESKVVNVLQSTSELCVLRVLWCGAGEQFNILLNELIAKGCSIVSCSEELGFLMGASSGV